MPKQEELSKKYGLPLIEIVVFRDQRLYEFPMKYALTFLKAVRNTPARTVYRHYNKYIKIKLTDRKE